MPYAFSIQGSQDNDTWTNIKTFLLGSNYWSSALQLGQWDIENDTAYKYYRLVVTNTAQGSYVRIGELGLSSYASFKGVNWYEDEYLVPIMSSDSQDGYIASASSSYSAGYAPWKAFNRTASGEGDCWCASSASTSDSNYYVNGWLQIQLPEAKCANYVTMVCRSGSMENSLKSPRDWTLKGSNDGETWTTLLTVTDQIPTSVAQSFSYPLENTNSYLYYRVDVTRISIAGQKISIAELNLVNRTYHENN